MRNKCVFSLWSQYWALSPGYAQVASPLFFNRLSRDVFKSTNRLRVCPYASKIFMFAVTSDESRCFVKARPSLLKRAAGSQPEHIQQMLSSGTAPQSKRGWISLWRKLGIRAGETWVVQPSCWTPVQLQCPISSPDSRLQVFLNLQKIHLCKHAFFLGYFASR